MAQEQGYNVYLKKGNDRFVGVTQDDLSISPITKSSITKEDNGVQREVVTGHNITFRVAGIVKMAGDTANTLHNDDILALALSKSSFSFTYVRGGGSNKSGVAIVTGYSESAPADPESDVTYSLDLEVQGELA